MVKTADGVYTDDPNATGEVRYYDATGNRADVPSIPNGTTRNTSVADFYKNQNAQALDLSQESNRQTVADQGRRSLQRVASMKDEAAQRSQREYLAQLSPADMADLMQAQIKEQGENSRASATLQVQREGQKAGMINALGTQGQRSFDNDLKLSERLTNPETRQAEISRILAPLRGLSRDARVQALSDPNNTPIQAAIAALEDDARAGQGGIGALGGLGRNSTFADVSEDGFFPGFSDATTAFGGFTDPTELNPQLDEELYRDLIRARRNQSARGR